LQPEAEDWGPTSRIRHQASGIRHQASGIRDHGTDPGWMLNAKSRSRGNRHTAVQMCPCGMRFDCLKPSHDHTKILGEVLKAVPPFHCSVIVDLDPNPTEGNAGVLGDLHVPNLMGSVELN
jgi:hypothetical protein